MSGKSRKKQLNEQEIRSYDAHTVVNYTQYHLVGISVITPMHHARVIKLERNISQSNWINIYKEKNRYMTELPLNIRERLLKTTPSPDGSGEFETSPFASLTSTPLHSPFATLRSGRLTGGYGANVIQNR